MTWMQREGREDLPNMNMFRNWLSEKIVISVYDWFFKILISTVLLHFIVLLNQTQQLFV